MPHLPPFSLRNPTYAALTAGVAVVTVLYLHRRHATVKRRRAGLPDDETPDYFKVFAGTCGVAYLLARFLGGGGAAKKTMAGGGGGGGDADGPFPTIEEVMKYIDNGDPDF